MESRAQVARLIAPSLRCCLSCFAACSDQDSQEDNAPACQTECRLLLDFEPPDARIRLVLVWWSCPVLLEAFGAAFACDIYIRPVKLPMGQRLVSTCCLCSVIVLVGCVKFHDDHPGIAGEALVAWLCIRKLMSFFGSKSTFQSDNFTYRFPTS